MSMPSLGPEDVEPPLTPASEPGAGIRDRRQPDQPAIPLAMIRGGAGEVESSGQALQPNRTSKPEPLAPRSGWTLVALIPHDGKEPPAGLADDLAQAAGAPSRRSGIPRCSPGRRNCPDRADRDSLVAGTEGNPRRSRPGHWTGSLPATGPRPRTPARSCSSREPTAPH